jgi:hypothetical protein
VAKQEAFEEKIKLKNQFRSLDEDEVDFLDSIMESTRAQEAAVKRETAEQLELFRRQREEAEKVALEEGSADVAPPAEGEDWKIPARKRRRDKKDFLVPGKKRKSTAEVAGEQKTDKDIKDPVKGGKKESVPARAQKAELKESKSTVNSASSASPVVGGEAKVAAPAETEQKQAANPSSLSLGLSGYSSDSE